MRLREANGPPIEEVRVRYLAIDWAVCGVDWRVVARMTKEFLSRVVLRATKLIQLRGSLPAPDGWKSHKKAAVKSSAGEVLLVKNV